MPFTRYAIYYAPPAKEAWVSFATSWLGWDMQAGEIAAHPRIPGLPGEVREITRVPRRYGLHATLKPPFRLAAGFDQRDLEAACSDLSRDLTRVALGRLHLTRLGRFLALCVPCSGELSDLAAACVRVLDRFRAAPSAQELGTRRSAGLTPRQEQNLITWGYPHVGDDFRFHLTLTGRLRQSELKDVEAALEARLVPLLPEYTTLGDLALAGEDPQGRFHLLRRFGLSALAPGL